MKKNLIDRVVEYVSPSLASQRYASKFAISTIERHYEGASKGRRTDGWKSPSTDSNATFNGSLQTLRNRHRDLVRNNPSAKRAVQIISTNVVGMGIRGEVSSKNKQNAKKITELWDKWAGTTACDHDNKNNFYGLQRLAIRSIVEGGGVIIRKRRKKYSDKATVPLKLQLLEPDFIDHSKRGSNGDNHIFQGIEFAPDGEVVAYYLYDQHPGNAHGLRSIRSRRVDASEIKYIYRVDRIGQSHGVPWGTPVFIKLKDFDDYEDAQLVRQKIASCFAAFIHDSTGNHGATGIDKATSDDTSLVDKFEPGIIEILPPGKDIKMASPPSVQNYQEYTSVSLHSIATGYDVPYEALTGDYSQVNYSSARMAWNQFGRDLDDWQHLMLIPQLCDGCFEWFLEAISFLGVHIDSAMMKWIPPRRLLLDPTKEIPAKIKEIRGGLTTLRRALKSMGLNPDDIYQEREEDNKILDDKGIVLDSDPRHVTSGGTLQKEKDTENAEEE